MKRLLAGLMAFCVLGLNTAPVFAAVNSVKDVTPDYWASKEIKQIVNEKVMDLDNSGCFNPEKAMNRAEFVHSLLKILSNDNLDVNIRNSFSDVKDTDKEYTDILRSQQLGLVYGYPDGTFRASKSLLRSETTSIISHITKESYKNSVDLSKFTDVNEIPDWAKDAYAKTVHYGLYVNHPYETAFNPNNDLTRAEAAVLLALLRTKLALVKDQYKKEYFVKTEHLNVSEKAPSNEVTVTNLRKIVLKNNVLSIAYDEKFFSKKAKAGDMVNFVVEQNVYTEEGTLVIPAKTKFVAEVLKIQNPKWFNKNARVQMKFRNMVAPDGKTYAIDANPFTKDGLLKEGPWMTTGKLVASTLTMGIVGAGAGVGFAFIPTPAKIGTGLAIGIPVGCTVGLATGLVTPGLHYKTKVGEKLLIILQNDASFWNPEL